MTTTQTIQPTETPVTSIPIERDEFCDPSYVDPNAKLPRIQALRGTTKAKCGYFIPIDQLAASGWLDFNEKQLQTYTYEASGHQEQGLLIGQPRMLVCPKSPVLGFDRTLSDETESLVVVGEYNREFKNDPNIGNTQYFQVVLLDEHNQPLHVTPFIYRASGANHATFSQHWQQLCREVEACHAIANQISGLQKDWRFRSLCVFCFTTGRETARSTLTSKKSPACKVISHEVPKLDNWKDYFVGFDRQRKDWIWSALQPSQPLIVPSAEMPLLSSNNEPSTARAQEG